MKKLCIAFGLLLPLAVFGQPGQSLSLEQSIVTALRNNYGIIIQDKNLGISKSANTWGYVGALPGISLSGTASNILTDNDSDSFTTESYGGTVSLNWVLFRGFGALIEKSKMEELEKLSQGNLEIVVENTLSSVILSYYNVLLQEENMKITEELMSLSKDRYSSEQLKTELGTSVSTDLLLAQNAWLEDKSAYLSAQASYNNAVRQLNFLMAEPLDRQYQFSASFSADTTSFSKSELLERMLSGNQTLENQYVNLEMAKLNVQSARSDFLPTVTAGISHGYSDTETAYDINTMMDIESSGSSTAFSLGVSFSLFDGGRKRQALKAAKLEEEIAEVEAEEMRAELENELSQELELYRVRKEMLRLADENLNAAELNMTISRQKFESGAINSFDFRDIQQIYLNASLSRHNTIYGVIQSYHTLLRLTCGLIEAYH